MFPTPSAPLYTRRRLIRGLLSLPLLGGGYASLVEPHLLTVTHTSIPCASLPMALNGLTIAHLSDFHFNPRLDSYVIRKIIDYTHANPPDLIALTGDFIDHNAAYLPEILQHLDQLQSKFGIFAVLGNHDGWNMSRANLQQAFAQTKIQLLINQNHRIAIAKHSITLAGSDFIWLGHPDPAAMFQSIPTHETVIALVHEPDYFDTIIQHFPVALQLSGHTHGGQCRVPILDYAPIKVKFGEKYLYGHYSKNQSNLFVTRGIGTTGIRVRFAAPPELAILTLTSPS